MQHLSQGRRPRNQVARTAGLVTAVAARWYAGRRIGDAFRPWRGDLGHSERGVGCDRTWKRSSWSEVPELCAPSSPPCPFSWSSPAKSRIAPQR